MALDTSIPGNPVMDDWSAPPILPFHISDFDTYREGDPQAHGTMFVELKDSVGNVFPFFFDRFLGRLCYGTHDEDDDAAFIRKGSKFESEAFSAIEAAALAPEFEAVLNRLAHARRWKGESKS